MCWGKSHENPKAIAKKIRRFAKIFNPAFMSITIIIILFTALTSFLAFGNSDLFYKLRFNPSQIHQRRQWYRFVSYGLLHADLMHLLVNMFVLWSFGSVVEQAYDLYFFPRGNYYFILLYLGGLAFSTLPSFGKHKHNAGYNAVGASGAVSAILFASIILSPQSKIMFLFFPVPIPAFLFGILYLVYSAYMARRAKDNIGHDAHFWGAVFGVLFTVALNPSFAIDFFRNIV